MILNTTYGSDGMSRGVGLDPAPLIVFGGASRIQQSPPSFGPARRTSVKAVLEKRLGMPSTDGLQTVAAAIVMSDRPAYDE